MKNAVLLILMLISAQIAAAQKIVSCDIEASINNKAPNMTTDPFGTNVRKGPGKNFPILKTLRDQTGFLFHITGSQGNWVRIDEVFIWKETERQKLDGWVYAPSLFVIVDHNGAEDEPFVSNLYAAPDWKSRLLLPKNLSIYEALPLQGCQGQWAKVRYEGKIGWLNPYSHCPALWDDGPCSQGEDF